MSTPTIRQLVSATLTKASDSPQDRAVLSSIVESHVRRTDDGIVVIDGTGNARTNANGEPLSFSEFVAEVQRQRPELFSVSKPVKSREAGAKPTVIPITPGMSLTDRMKAMKANQQASAKDQATEIAAKGNPWNKATPNLTDQMRIAILDPELAGKLKAVAGVKS